jgi:acetyl esterase/lipase
MHRLSIFLIFLFISQYALAQVCESNRYQQAVFPSVTVSEGIVYGEVDRYDAFNIPFPQDIRLDVYEPQGDTRAKRPVVFMAFGGAYVIGDRGHADIVAWCDSLASYGYVAVSLDYRLGLNALSEGSAVRAMYRAVQDTRAAIRYMLENQATFRIDPEHIYLGGESAGAINALHAAFMDEDERPEASFGIPLEPGDLGCLDCDGNDFQNDFDIAGVINLWGAVIDPLMIDADEQIPTLHIHGEDDLIVPLEGGYPFIQNFQLSFPYVHASQPIHERMDLLGIYNEFYTYPGEGHLFYGLPDGIITFPNDNWEPVWQQGHEFLYHTLQFTTDTPTGNQEACLGQSHAYALPFSEGAEYCWEVQGGTVVQDNGHEILVEWEEGGGTVSVVEHNCIGVVGEESDALVVTTISTLPIAGFTAASLTDDTYYFEDTSLYGFTYTLDFGDGSAQQTVAAGQAITYTYTSSGTFTVTQTVTNSCGTATATVVVTAQGTATYSPEEALGVQVFPSLLPSGEYIRIDTQGQIFPEGLRLDLYDIQGRSLGGSLLHESGTLSTQGLPKGVYILRLQAGGVSAVSKILVL